VKLGADQENPGFCAIIGSSFCPSHHSVRPYTHLSFFYNRPALRLYAVHPFRSKFKNCKKCAPVVSLFFRPYWARTFNGIGLPGRARPENAIHGGKLYLHYGVSNAAALAERIRYDLGCGRLAGAATSSLVRVGRRTAEVAPSAPKKANPFLRNWRRGG